MVLKRTGIFIALFLLAFFACKTHYSVVSKEAKHHSLQNVNSSRKYDSVIAPYKGKLIAEMEKQLVMCEGDLTKDGAETTLGNFVCDAMKWAFDSIIGTKSSSIVLMNRGGLRASIPKGIVTVNMIFELMPFDNELEFVIIKGKELEEVIERVVEKKHAFYDMKIIVDPTGKYTATAQGFTVDPYSNYNLLCADFVVNGGDGFTFGKKLVHEKKLGITLRDAIINYCRHLRYTRKTIIPYKDGRFEISK